MRRVQMLTRFSLVFIFLVSLFSQPKSEVFSSVCGKVTDSLSQQGIPNVSLFLTFHKSSRAKSDKDGNFCFEKIPPGTFTLSYMSGTFVTPNYKTIAVNVKKGANVKNILIKMVKGTRIEGVLFENDGISPIPDRTIFFINSNGETGIKTDSTGRFILKRARPGNDGFFQILGEDGEGYFRIGNNIKTDVGEEKNINLVLPISDTLTGVEGFLKDKNGVPIQGIKIAIDTLTSQRTNFKQIPAVITNSQGFFKFRNLLPGDYTVLPTGFTLFSLPGCEDVAAQEIAAGQSIKITSLNVVTIELKISCFEAQ